jgi:Tol biopolymer transport system component/serine/threonine protein kinase
MEPERWQRIEQLYHAALERDRERRNAFLAEACADDEALRGEVEMLLSANEKAGEFLAVPALELEAKQMAAEGPGQSLGVEVGQELSHYKILSSLGAGGMGEVYLAHDKILERRVALKLLPVQYTQNDERLQRFIQEAKAASALNHPNIITIYEIGEVATAQGMTYFMATEYIEGETLRDWRSDEAERVRQTLKIVIQVASALDAAHRAGIVHRDIKPENVMVRPDGLVKVLDFGLAKLISRPVSSLDTEADTIVEAIRTVPGMLLGTLRYMSPEQARGRGVDARSDIFSLGIVLYEMLTGEALFAGETDADVVAGIIHKEAPPLALYLSDVPVELERIVRKTLAKDAGQRYQDVRDLEIDLRALDQESELTARLARSGPVTGKNLAAQTSGALAAPRFSLRQLLLGLTVALALVGAIWWLMTRRSEVETPPPESLRTIEVVTWQSAPGEVYSVGAFSPDGKMVAFTSTQGGSKNIWIKQVATGDAIRSTEDELQNENPIWSPNADEIAFYSTRGGQRGIWRKPLFGGSPKSVKPLGQNERDIKLDYWSKNGATIYYESNQNLFAFNLNTGETTQLTSLDTAKAKVVAYSLSISPDERRIAFISINDAGGSTLYVLPVRGGEATPVARMSGGDRNTVWHPDGERVLYSAAVDGIYQVFVADIYARKPVQITFGDRDSSVLDVSADGTKVLYGTSKEESDVWGVNVEKAEEFTVASDISSELWPHISPDSRAVAYQSVRNLSQGNKILRSLIQTRQLDASGQTSALAQEGALPRWSPDGVRLAFLRISNRALGIWTINAAGGEEKQLTTGGLPSIGYSLLPYQRYETNNFEWSPDSRRLVYCSSRNGQSNLWLVAADGSSDIQITDNKDSNLLLRCPLWSKDGRRIAYSSNPGQIAPDGKVTYSVWLSEVETKNSRIIFEADSYLRLIGWTPTGQELILATIKRKIGAGTPTEVQLLRVSARTGERRVLATLQSAYLYNIHLSADGRTVAFSSRQEEKDNIWVIPADGGGPRKMSANNDPRFYISSMAWSPDGKTIYFGKQVRHSQLWMISNFE